VSSSGGRQATGSDADELLATVADGPGCGFVSVVTVNVLVANAPCVTAALRQRRDNYQAFTTALYSKMESAERFLTPRWIVGGQLLAIFEQFEDPQSEFELASRALDVVLQQRFGLVDMSFDRAAVKTHDARRLLRHTVSREIRF
jgi:hypothetical protein